MEAKKKGKCCARIYVLISRTSILLKRVRVAANVHSNRSSSVVEWTAAFIYIEIDEWMRNDIINKSLRTSANRFLACPTFATFKHSNSLSHFKLTELIPPLSTPRSTNIHHRHASVLAAGKVNETKRKKISFPHFASSPPPPPPSGDRFHVRFVLRRKRKVKINEGEIICRIHNHELSSGLWEWGVWGFSGRAGGAAVWRVWNENEWVEGTQTVGSEKMCCNCYFSGYKFIIPLPLTPWLTLGPEYRTLFSAFLPRVNVFIMYNTRRCDVVVVRRCVRARIK